MTCRSALWKTVLLPIFLLLPVQAADPARPWRPLWKDKAPGTVSASEPEAFIKPECLSRISTPALQIWEPDTPASSPRPALCIFPGGGYGLLALRLEGEDIARWAVKQGMVAVIVKYRVTDRAKEAYRYPVPLTDARRAVRLVRQNASEWGIDPARIGVIGFSAGGHLAAVTTTTWNRPLEGETNDDTDKISSRPDFSLLIYPVISMTAPYAHGCKSTLLGTHPSPEKAVFSSPEKQITPQTPPLFLLHAADDPVSCLNSLDMARAAQEKGVPVELHLFPRGGHGYGMEKRGNPTDCWPDLAKEWLHRIGILTSPAPVQPGK